MLADWSAECAADDPVLVVPWFDPSGKAAFVDLRENPYDFDSIPEAETYPPLMHALRALNGSRSPVFTAKCDVWRVPADELVRLRMELDLTEEEAAAGFASYIDVIWRARTVFTSFARHEQALQKLTRSAASLQIPGAAMEYVLRPAVLDTAGQPREGFAVTIYVKAVGVDEGSALREWGESLEAVAALFRRKDLHT